MLLLSSDTLIDCRILIAKESKSIEVIERPPVIAVSNTLSPNVAIDDVEVEFELDVYNETDEKIELTTDTELYFHNQPPVRVVSTKLAYPVVVYPHSSARLYFKRVKIPRGFRAGDYYPVIHTVPAFGAVFKVLVTEPFRIAPDWLIIDRNNSPYRIRGDCSFHNVWVKEDGVLSVEGSRIVCNRLRVDGEAYTPPENEEGGIVISAKRWVRLEEKGKVKCNYFWVLTDYFTQEGNSVIDVSGGGYLAGRGPGAGKPGFFQGGGGGGFGGKGGDGVNNPGSGGKPCSLLRTPYGSGGGWVYGFEAGSSEGGGAVLIQAKKWVWLRDNAEILARGASGTTLDLTPLGFGTGGGSGGSVIIDAESCTIESGCKIDASGGSGGNGDVCGGGGGGGWIAIFTKAGETPYVRGELKVDGGSALRGAEPGEKGQIICAEGVLLGTPTSLSYDEVVDKRTYAVYVPDKYGGVLTVSVFPTGMVEVHSTWQRPFVDTNPTSTVAEGEIRSPDYGFYLIEVRDAPQQFRLEATFKQESVATISPWHFWYFPFAPTAPGPHAWDTLNAPRESGRKEAPLWKYDYIFDTNALEWENEHHKQGADWVGHCGFAATASIIFEEPRRKTVQVPGKEPITLLWEDIEFLVTAYAGAYIKTHPNEIYEELKDGTPTLERGESVDPFAGVFHKHLRDQIRGKGLPFVADLSPAKGQKWFHAICAYSSTFTLKPVEGLTFLYSLFEAHIETEFIANRGNTYPSSGTCQTRPDLNEIWKTSYTLWYDKGEVEGRGGYYSKHNWKYIMYNGMLVRAPASLFHAPEKGDISEEVVGKGNPFIIKEALEKLGIKKNRRYR